MKIYVPFLLFIFNSLIVYSQQISGRVIDAETGKPLVKVNIYTSNTDIGTFTNKAGYFKLNFNRSPQADEVIYFTHIGYKTQEYSLSELNDAKFMIKMIEDTTPLDEVNLLSKYQLRSHLKFKSLPSMPKGIYGADAILMNDRIYIYGGDMTTEIDALKKAIINNPSEGNLLKLLAKAYSHDLGAFAGYISDIQIFDLAKNDWHIEKTELQKRAYHSMIYDEDNQEIYVIGGKKISPNRKFQYLQNEIDIIDLKNDTILTDKTNPHQAVNFASFISGDYVVVMGGSIKQKRNGSKIYSNKIHTLNTKTGLWYELGNMPQAKETSGVLIDNIVYLFGGNNGELLPYIEKYNLRNGKWSRIGKLFEPVLKPGLAYKDDKIFIYYPGSLCVYNLKIGVLDRYNIAFYVNAPELFNYKNKLYLIGGYNKNEYTKREPSSRVISIDLNELKRTQIKETKRINKTI